MRKNRDSSLLSYFNEFKRRKKRMNLYFIYSTYKNIPWVKIGMFSQALFLPVCFETLTKVPPPKTADVNFESRSTNQFSILKF